MTPSARLCNLLHPVVGFPPTDINTVPTGKYVNMGKAQSALIVLFTGTVGADFTVHVNQATAGDGTGAKRVPLPAADYAWRIDNTADTDHDADRAELVAVANAGTSTAQVAHGNAANRLVMIHVDLSLLDLTNGFRWINVAVSDPGATTNAACLILLFGLRNGGPPENQGSCVIA